MNATPLEQLRDACAPQWVELPGFAPGETVVFRLRRANLRALAASGRIPNPLLPAAQRLYEGGGTAESVSFADVARVMQAVVESALVEPTAAELAENGVELTEEQFGLIFAYSQKGVAALETFRRQSGHAGPHPHGADVARASQPAS